MRAAGEAANAHWPVVLWIEKMTPPSNNILLRMHRYAYKRLRDSWREVLVASLDAPRFAERQLLMASAEEKVPMRIEILVFRSRLLDEDNLAGGVKPVLDALKTSQHGLGWIWNDSPEFLKLFVRQEKHWRIGTEISITPKDFYENRL
jgi:hypothetical protein